jgi:hypothetical protein
MVTTVEKNPVLAEHPILSVSGKYAMISTAEVLKALEKKGFTPFKTQITNAKESNQGFQKHLIRLRNPAISLDVQNIPEILLENSHDGRCSYHLMMGIYRQVCSNGLCVCKRVFEDLRIRHVGFNPNELFMWTEQFADGLRKVHENIRFMEAKLINTAQQFDFAIKAALLAEMNDKVQPLELLKPRRVVDAQTISSVWTTMNVVQENVMKGGVRYATRDQRDRPVRRRTRLIKNIDRELKFNQGIWEVAQSYLN